MKKTIFLIVIISTFTSNSIIAQKTAFDLYKTATNDWKPSIFTKYIKDYADIDVDAILLNHYEMSAIEEEIKYHDHKYTEDFDEVIEAVDKGKKVFFFIENYVWGGVEEGTTFSGSWQRKMPMVSGFYLHNNKCFQNEGINYHCGKKSKAHETRFYIIN